MHSNNFSNVFPHVHNTKEMVYWLTDLMVIPSKEVLPSEAECNAEFQAGCVYPMRTKQVKSRETYEYTSSSEQEGSEEDVLLTEDIQVLETGGQQSSSYESDMIPADREKISDESINDACDSNNCPIQIAATNNTDTKRKYDKRHYCLFCSKPYARISKHWLSIHDTEKLVIEISSETHAVKKKALVTKLRNTGDYMHNKDVIKEGKGSLVVAYRPNSKQRGKTPDDYRVCETCAGSFRTGQLYRHKCKVDPNRKKGRVALRAKMLLPAPTSVRPDVIKLIQGMKDDDVRKAILKDPILLKLASKLYVRHGNAKTYLISARLREMGRVVAHLQTSLGKFSTSLIDYLKPRMFRTVVRAVRSVAGFDEKSLIYKHPSVGIKIGHTLRKCCQIVKGQAIETSDKELAEDARQFEDLCEMDWTEEITHSAKRQLYERKRNAVKRLPLSEDTKKIVDFLKKEIAEKKKNLSTNIDNISVVWRNLSELVLAYLIIFNRRRQGEVSKVQLQEFKNAKRGTASKDLEGCLSEIEKQLCKLFHRLEIAGKRGRTVPLLIDDKIFEAINMLVAKRLQAGVAEENNYLFAVNNSASLCHIRGSDCLRKFSLECGAKFPATLRSTSFRKHVATMSQIMSLKNNELELLAQFMGHDIRTHREFYRLPQDTLQLAKLSKVFLLMEQGRVDKFRGKTLDNVLLNIDAGQLLLH